MISMPFSPEMVAAAIDGRKCCTTRSKPYGKPGDIFQVNGARFRLLEINIRTLYYVRQQLYRLEGFDTPEAFERTWRILHRNQFDASRAYFVHYFARADGGDR